MMNSDSLARHWNWQPAMADLLRFPFENAHAIQKNFSQAWQDLFVLSMLDGRSNGRYLEIGANFARSNNNTCLLGSGFGWEGVSIEFDPQFLRSWQQERPDDNLVIADALALDYVQALPRWFGAGCNRLDYLQLDIDPSYNTLLALKRLPLDDWRFSVITFETDAYLGDPRARDESREIFSRHGYELVAADLCVLFVTASPDPIPFEDWWVDPQVVSRDKIDALKRLAAQPLLPQHLLFSAA